MSKFADWFNRLLGMGDDDEDMEEEYTPAVSIPNTDIPRDSASRISPKKKELPAVTTINNVTVMVISPISFDEAKKAVDYIKGNRPVVANFEDTDRVLFQRFIDFVSGAVYSMEGKIEKISQFVFLFAPPNVLINAEDKKKFISESAAVNKKSFLDS
ncbi:MAG TPA: cell division protein SepF [Caldisericia bacterium]|nr:cell division protein SepF [Caldisericia bacterium]